FVIEVGILAEKPRFESFVDTQHIVHYEYLSVAAGPSTDPDGGDADGFRYLRCKCSRYLLKYHGKATGIFQYFGIGFKLVGLGIFFCPYGISPEFVDGLWREAQVAHHGDARVDDALYSFLDFDAAFHFQSMRTGFLHYAHGSLQGVAA